jgi:TolB-like protein/DNA-binding winged helix-turn-helix (wHTH) protein
MTIREDEAPAPTRARRLQFDRYVLDLDRGCVLLGGNEIALRPKTFAILHCLVENTGRLVSKDELFAAVWPNLAITDDVLVQSIGELRRALGDDGPRLIKTVPRRGYRFEAPVSAIGAVGRSPTDGAADSAAFQNGAYSPKPPTGLHASKLFTTALAGARGRLFAGLVLTILLVVGAAWTGIGSKFRSLLHPDHQFTESAEVSTKPAIAVLPFLNQGTVSGREYFADGLTQDLINALGRFSGLTVMSWNAVFPDKGKPASPGAIARSLSVRYQVEGSVQQTSDRVRVIAQLVDADGRVLWSARFDEASGPPGAKTPVHSHPGSESFYVLAGRLGQKTPQGVNYAEAGHSMNGHGPGTTMEVFSAGTTDLEQLVMFLVDATKPFSVPAKFE